MHTHTNTHIGTQTWLQISDESEGERNRERESVRIFFYLLLLPVYFCLFSTIHLLKRHSRARREQRNCVWNENICRLLPCFFSVLLLIFFVSFSFFGVYFHDWALFWNSFLPKFPHFLHNSYWTLLKTFIPNQNILRLVILRIIAEMNH